MNFAHKIRRFSWFALAAIAGLLVATDGVSAACSMGKQARGDAACPGFRCCCEAADSEVTGTDLGNFEPALARIAQASQPETCPTDCGCRNQERPTSDSQSEGASERTSEPAGHVSSIDTKSIRVAGSASGAAALASPYLPRNPLYLRLSRLLI